MRLLNDEEIMDVVLNEGLGVIADENTRAIAKAQYELDMKEFMEWGEEYCVLHPQTMPNGSLYASLHRRQCIVCWQSLKQENE